MSLPNNIKTPAGWEAHACDSQPGCFALRQTSFGGAVTVNFGRRWWNLGWGYSTSSKNIPGCTSNGKMYTGRGWQQRLVDDAAAALVAAEGHQRNNREQIRMYRKNDNRYESETGFVLLREHKSLTPNGNKMNGRWALRGPNAALIDFNFSLNDIVEHNNIRLETRSPHAKTPSPHP